MSSARGRSTRRNASAMNVIGLLLASAVCLGAAPAVACDGPDPGPVEARFERATTVAIIRVMSVSVSSANRGSVEGHAEVVETLKGTPVAMIPVRGYLPSVDCWASIDVGREYVVFLPNRIVGYEAWFSPFSESIPVANVPGGLLRKWRAKP
jgi:hypothetical protein